MLTRKTQYAWMAVGGMICLFGLVLACKLRDGNKAIAQDDKNGTTPPPLMESPLPPASLGKDLPPSIPTDMGAKSDKLGPPAFISGLKKPSNEKPKAEPKAVLEMPLPAPSSPLPMPVPPVSPKPSGLLPASFDSNTPTPKTNAKEEPKKKADPFMGIKPPTTWDKPSNSPPLPPLGSDPLPKEKAAGTPMAKTPPPPPSSVPLPPPMPKPPIPPVSPPPPYNEIKMTPTSFAPPSVPPASPDHDAKAQPGEPPLAPAPGPVQTYHVHGSETLQDIARRTLGSSDRASELHKLNPTLKTDAPLRAGTVVRLPGDACVQADDAEPVKPLPALRVKPTPPKAKVLPLTGTYQCSLDEKGQLTLPRALRDQFDGCDTVLLSPGPDKCLWLTNQPHLERLGERLEQSRANEADVRVFKRLYFAQTEKLTVNEDGRVGVPERLAQFAGLHQEVVLVGIDDHFEVWDAARWRQYTQQKSGGSRSAPASED